MSKYSELIGSFVRTSNFPLEANYIFDTKSDLITFFEEPLNQVLLHEGLLKIVLDDEGELALYWVIKNEDNLEFSKLISASSVGDLADAVKQLQEDLLKEIEERKLADIAIWGTEDYTLVDPDLNSLLKLSEAILDIREEIERLKELDRILKEELKATVGTVEEDIREYLKTLDYKNLTEVSKALNKFLNTYDSENLKVNTLPEIQAFLEGFNDQDTLMLILTDLWTTIEGTPLPNHPFRTLRGIEDVVETNLSYCKNRMDNIQSELDLTQIGVGLSSDGSYNPDKETYYLGDATSVMNALKILDSLINEAINNCNYLSEDTESVKIDIKKEPTKTTIKAWVKISPELGNDIITKEDGIYHNIDSEYENGILTIKVNGNIRKQHNLGLSTLVDDAYYDSDSESIIMIFKLHNGEKLTITIPTGALISEWEIDNSYSSKVVELTKERVISGGADKLSADVRISTNKYNILEKDANTLLVKGIADNIVYDGDVTVKSKLDSLVEHDNNTNLEISNLKDNLHNEIDRAKSEEHNLKDLIDTEITRATTTENNLDIKYLSEITESRRVESELTTNLNNEITRASSKEDELNSLITTNKDNLNSEVERAKLEELNLSDKIKNEELRATNLELNLNQRIDNLVEALEFEVERSTNEDTELSRLLQAEVYRAKESELILDDKFIDLGNKLTNEIKRSTDEDNRLDSILTDEILRSISKDEELETRINEVANSNTLVEEDTSSVDLTVVKTVNNTTIKADVIVSDNPNNLLKSLSSGLYTTFNITYNEAKNLLSFFNGFETKTLLLNSGSTINNMEYDKTTENLILYYTNAQGELSSVTINITDIIKEWDIFNDPNSVITLTKSEHKIDGIDILSASLKLSDKEGQLLLNIDGHLYASNNAKDIVFEDTNVDSKLKSLTDNIKDIDVKFDTFKTEIESSLNNLETKVDSKLEVFGNKYDTAIQVEVTRATSEEKRLEDLINNVNNKVVTNTQNTDLNILTIEEIKVKNAQLDSDITNLRDLINNEITRSTSEDSNIRDRITDLTERLTNEINRATTKENEIDTKLTNHINLATDSFSGLGTSIHEVRHDLDLHLVDYGNPHRVTKEQIGLDKVDNTTDLEKPISLAVLEEIHRIDREVDSKADYKDFLEHITDYNNPHLVTKEQVGLGNVDNTSDLDKPISTATLEALDEKSDKGHKHVMSDILDLENLPIVKGIIDLLTELPEDPEQGEKWLLKTQPNDTANVRYEIVEYDAVYQRWNLKLLTTGGIVCVINGDVYKLNSSGLERILDVSDYVYFYNKIYDETKDLIEDIDWEENDATNDTNLLIRLKITYKTKYGDPNESEATNPYKNKNVKYIDIEKGRFLANAYSRPAILDDVNKGYAVTVGEPLLILVMTTGDHVTISLKDSLNIYDPVETSSINMHVSDWTGNPSTSYKVSADVKIATTEDLKDAISLHILNNNGLYGTLHTTTTNSITLTPNYGTSGLKSLTADLNINNSLNNNSDVLLTIDSSGLSVKIIWGEYD